MSQDASTTAYTLLRNAHLVFGSLALLFFWVQIGLRKGGTRHLRLGWAYNAAMIGVLVSAVPMAVMTWFFGEIAISLFLGFLTVITFVAGLEAVMASRNRNSGAWIRGPIMKACTTTIFLYSLVLFVLYARTGMTLLLVMGLLGTAATVEYLARSRKNRPYNWVVEHINGMMGTGIAVHVAFFSFGLRRFFDGESFLLMAFIGPIAAGQLMAIYFRRKFIPQRRKQSLAPS